MAAEPERPSVILVLEDIEETRDGIERLLRASDYAVITARDEGEALFKAGLQPPDLILISLGLQAAASAAMGRRIRESACPSQRVPIVIFCVPGLAEGAEEIVDGDIHLTRPDNFNQLRDLLKRLVGTERPE